MFRLAEGLTVCLSQELFLYDLFCRYKAQMSPTLFSNFSMTFRTRLPDAFHHLVPNDNFDCQMTVKSSRLGD